MRVILAETHSAQWNMEHGTRLLLMMTEALRWEPYNKRKKYEKWPANEKVNEDRLWVSLPNTKHNIRWALATTSVSLELAATAQGHYQ